MIADIARGHTAVADWSLLLALVAFLAALALLVLDHRPRAADRPTAPDRTALVLPLSYVGLALIALALLVL